ncbi:MAG: DUF1330 domain-containing protein [Acidimicrobiales bacterium]
MNPFELEALQSHPDQEGPVYMVNLLKYREKSLDGDGSGRDAYSRYAVVAQPLLESLGAVVMWMGSVQHLVLNQGEDLDVDWDVVQLVVYPSREIFIQMVTSEEYLAANVHRENGTEKHLIFALKTVISNPFPAR